MGTPQFAVPALEALINSRHQVVAVYSQPPKPQGRRYIVQKSAVHLTAEAHSIPVYTPSTLKDLDVQQQFAAHQADLAIVAAYGLILPQAILDIPTHGCLNIHASLLPRWRGAAPIHRAMLAGDQQTGVTIMKMDKGLDTGDMLFDVVIDIPPQVHVQDLTQNLATVGAQAIVQACDNLPGYLNNLTKQPEQGITYAHKLTKHEGFIDWHTCSTQLVDVMVRTLNPWPGCYFVYRGQIVKVLGVKIVCCGHDDQCGTIIDSDFTIACQDGYVTLMQVKPAGKQAMSGRDFMNGQPLKIGDIL